MASATRFAATVSTEWVCRSCLKTYRSREALSDHIRVRHAGLSDRDRSTLADTGRRTVLR